MQRRSSYKALVVALLGLVGGLAATGVAAVVGAGAPAQAASQWAPAVSAKIHPGVQMYTKGAQCTANFVFTDRSGRVYVGYAAHCAGLGAATDTDGCSTSSLPLGTRVVFGEGGSALSDATTVGRGRLVYSSWLTMRLRGTKAVNACAYNDFALVRVGPRFVDRVNPSVPQWGGPTAVRTTGLAAGDRVYSYGNSSLRPGIALLNPKLGISLGDSGNGWSHDVYTLTPGIPGDSGSGFVDGLGRATGVLSTVALAPLPGANGVGDLYLELMYARRHSGIEGLRLVPGTEPFRGLL